jgi:hypothetical protein
LQVACRTIEIQHFEEFLIRGFGIDALGVEIGGFANAFSLEVVVTLVLEVQSDL